MQLFVRTQIVRTINLGLSHEKVVPFYHCCFYSFLVKGISNLLASLAKTFNLQKSFLQLNSKQIVFLYDAAFLCTQKKLL